MNRNHLRKLNAMDLELLSDIDSVMYALITIRASVHNITANFPHQASDTLYAPDRSHRMVTEIMEGELKAMRTTIDTMFTCAYMPKNVLEVWKVSTRAYTNAELNVKARSEDERMIKYTADLCNLLVELRHKYMKHCEDTYDDTFTHEWEKGWKDWRPATLLLMRHSDIILHIHNELQEAKWPSQTRS